MDITYFLDVVPFSAHVGIFQKLHDPVISMSFLNEANDIIGTPSQQCPFGSVSEPLHAANVPGMLLCIHINTYIHIHIHIYACYMHLCIVHIYMYNAYMYV